MKKLRIIIGIVALVLISNACDDDFLDRSPLDQVGAFDFFKSPGDMETYVNQFYDNAAFPISSEYGRDYDSDNAVSVNVNTWLDGSRTLDGAGGIPFADVRAINYFFDNYTRIDTEQYDFDDYKQYVGEAHFFKALIYFNLLQNYGDIQWYDDALGTSSEALYKPRDPRNVVADKIIASLDTAAMYMSESKTDGASRVNKWMALLIQSRVALFEGTWQKYHAGTAFAAANPEPEKYLNKAAEAAAAVINSGLYDIYSTGNPTVDYYNLFAQRDYSSNKEVMFWKKFDNELGKGEAAFRRQPNHGGQYPNQHSLTKEFADSYLSIDGDPIAVSDLFQGHATVTDEAQNRDPRFYQTIGVPDAIWKTYPDGSVEYYSELYEKLNTQAEYNSPAGYLIRKAYDSRVIYQIPQYEETPGIVYRYAEVLLNYAEAKAELGTITQADIDMSIKKLRDRVGMPNIDLANIKTDPNWDFPTLSPIINEVRRERRVELVGEGLRAADIKRWAAADELIVGKRPKGFMASQVATNPYPVDENGFLDPYKNIIPEGYGFDVNRDYLNAIPKTQIELNPNLTQNPGWQ